MMSLIWYQMQLFQNRNQQTPFKIDAREQLLNLVLTMEIKLVLINHKILILMAEEVEAEKR